MMSHCGGIYSPLQSAGGSELIYPFLVCDETPACVSGQWFMQTQRHNWLSCSMSRNHGLNISYNVLSDQHSHL